MLGRTALSRGVTTHHLSKNVTLYMNELASPASGCQTKASEDNKPLTLMLPWLGSRPQAVAKYCEIYFRTGFDVLVVESEVKEFLWPRWGLDHGKSLLELLNSERFVSRPLLVHAFSIGGYTFSQLLVHVSKDTQKYQDLTNRIKGQVYDSLVVGSLETMAVGLGKTVFPRWETLVKQNDPLSDPQALEELIDFWQKRGINITAKKWEDSTHAGHIKRHPQEYVTTLDMFLHSLHIAPLKAKM
ncbi:uncharacterized protein si:dkey-5i3.5 isoform X2 [Thunnus maccoyii]|uniref:uncharacterized protein si:dkey-5i3.5 isoform X2 n=1 Tax=Thunnus maccoyii TaxID=8240 RepID=UPI001C4DA481|nr:uncharacterized protein si:dkey-5i3.5 isoform X2 [Thunnus maccoyii]